MPLPKAPKQRASRLDVSSYANDLSPTPLNEPPATPPPVAATAEVVQLPTPVARAAGGASATQAKTAKPSKRLRRHRATSGTCSRKPTGPTKLFVLDTNVLMHDPMSCIFRFEEHDVFLPMITLEELDGHKKGMTEVARNVRQVSRDLDTLAASLEGAGVEEMVRGLPLGSTGHREGPGPAVLPDHADQRHPAPGSAPRQPTTRSGVVQSLKDQQPGREVVLVSKDINMRIKARALGLPAEDYRNDKALEDSDLLYTGVQALPADFWERHGKTMESWQQGGTTFYRISGPLVPSLLINQFVYPKRRAPRRSMKVTEITGKSAVLKTLKDYTHQKHAVWGITARNREQNFALNLLMDPDATSSPSPARPAPARR